MSGTTKYEWDEAKRRSNWRKHGFDFSDLDTFDLDNAMIMEDRFARYGEARFLAIGPMGSKLVALVYTERGDAVRAISLRQASRRENQLYVRFQTR